MPERFTGESGKSMLGDGFSYREAGALMMGLLLLQEWTNGTIAVPNAHMARALVTANFKYEEIESILRRFQAMEDQLRKESYNV